VWPEQVEWALEGDGGPTRDKYGEELVHELADRLRRAGKRFEDEYFPPSDESLYQFTAPSCEEVEDPTAEPVRRDHCKFGCDNDGKPLEVVWERGTEIAARRGLPPSAAVIFSRDPHDPERLSVDPDDIAQGSLGDCWFLAAIASCAASESDRLIKDLIVEEGWDVGLIGVKFFVRGSWTTVIIDDFFPLAPVDPGTSETDRALIFASSKQHVGQRVDEIEFWPMVLEKAFAKLHGSWEAIGANGGRPEDALHYLTGAPTVGLLDRRADPDAAWQQLKDLIKDPDDVDEKVGFVSATLRKDLALEEARSSGLIYGHAYSILACLEDEATAGQILRDGSKAVGPSLTRSGEVVRLVCVRNPWGEGEWKGAYNDTDTVRWTDRLVELARAANADAEVLSRTQSGKVSGSDDGSFWMEWSDVTKYLR
jgi:hypothetical protein